MRTNSAVTLCGSVVVEPFACKTQPPRGFTAVAGIAVERGADQPVLHVGVLEQFFHLRGLAFDRDLGRWPHPG